MGGESKTKDFFRLFVIPDYGMCAAMFPGTFDALGAVQKWVEEGVAPDQIKTTYAEQGRQFRERAGMQDTPESKSPGPQDTAGMPLSGGSNLQGERRYERRGKFQMRQADLEVAGKEESEIRKSDTPRVRGL